MSILSKVTTTSSWADPAAESSSIALSGRLTSVKGCRHTDHSKCRRYGQGECLSIYALMLHGLQDAVAPVKITLTIAGSGPPTAGSWLSMPVQSQLKITFAQLPLTCICHCGCYPGPPKAYKNWWENVSQDRDFAWVAVSIVGSKSLLWDHSLCVFGAYAAVSGKHHRQPCHSTRLPTWSHSTKGKLERNLIRSSSNRTETGSLNGSNLGSSSSKVDGFVWYSSIFRQLESTCSSAAAWTSFPPVTSGLANFLFIRWSACTSM